MLAWVLRPEVDLSAKAGRPVAGVGFAVAVTGFEVGALVEALLTGTEPVVFEGLVLPPVAPPPVLGPGLPVPL